MVRLQRLLVIGLTLSLSGCNSLVRPRAATPTSGVDVRFDRELSLARLSERHGQLDDAEAVYERVIRLDPEHVTAHHRLGVVSARKVNLEKALFHFAAAQQLRPNDSVLASDIGYAHYLAGDVTQAEAALTHALRLDSGNQQALNNMGLVLAMQGRDRESLAAFQQVSPPAMAMANLAFGQAQRGDLQASQQMYHRSLNLNPELRPAALALLKVNQHDGRLEKMMSHKGQIAQVATDTPRRSETLPSRQIVAALPERVKLQSSETPISEEAHVRHVRTGDASRQVSPSRPRTARLVGTTDVAAAKSSVQATSRRTAMNLAPVVRLQPRPSGRPAPVINKRGLAWDKKTIAGPSSRRKVGDVVVAAYEAEIDKL